MAYKLTQPVSFLVLTMVDPLYKTLNNINIKIDLKADNEWHYGCINIKEQWLAANKDSKYSYSIMKVHSAGFYPWNGMVDVVSIRKKLPLGVTLESVLIDDQFVSRRSFPTIQYQAGTLSVNKSAASIDFSFRPTNCSSDLPLFALNSTYTDFDPTIERTKEASPGVTGHFSLTWNGETLSEIPANIEEDEFSSLLESIPSFGFAKVTRSKDCSGYKWNIKWLNGGDKETLTISSNDLAGSSVAIAVNRVQEGGASFSPIQGDFLRTYHSKPQVSVLINDIPTVCSNCSFEWLSSATPVVNTIDVTSPSAIAIEGTGFSTTLTDNIVLIGDVPCHVKSATTTRLVCEAGLNPVGTYSFEVGVLGQGLATMNADTTISFSFNAVSASPTTGSTGGGNKILVTGTGFGSSTTVTVDGNDCKVVGVSYFAISCIVPPSDTSSNKQVDIVVNDISHVSTLSDAYLYDYDNTPVVDSIEPNVLSVGGGELITITGTSLPVVSNVKFGDYDVSIISSDASTLVIRSPAAQPGIYDLKLLLETSGYARVTQKVEYKLYVSSFTPNIGSINGGSKVTIYGDGFDRFVTSLLFFVAI